MAIGRSGRRAAGSTILKTILAVSMAWSTGCTVTQLRSTTTDLAPSIGDIERMQIIANLERFAEDPAVLPSQFVLGAGSASVSNQFQPSIASLNFSGVAIKGIGLQDRNQISVGWSVAPVTDFGDLQRLEALYRYALGYIDLQTFVAEYTTAVAPALFYDSAMIAPRSRKNVPPSYLQTTDAPTFHMPLPPEGLPLTDPGTWSPPLPNGQFIYKDNPPPGASALLQITVFGGPVLYVRSKKDLDEFTLWVIGATPSTSTGGGASKASGGGGARSLPGPTGPTLLQGGGL